jgi:hypothetical protein
MRTSRILVMQGALGLLLSAGCYTKKSSDQHFYEQHIQPIFNTSCINNTSPCHKPDPETGIALGNLDLSSFEGVQKRRDVLRTYGNYPQPLLLLKALPENQVLIPYRQHLYQSEIRHAGDKALSSNSDAYYELKRWLDNGANRDGILPLAGPNAGRPGCNTALPPGWVAPAIDATMAQAYDMFQNQVWPKVKDSCAFSTCHSSPQSDFYMTCGDTAEQKQFNFVQAAGFVAPCRRDMNGACLPTTDDRSVEQSELLLRPLSTRAGGINHTGGVFFLSRDDATWKLWRDWGIEVQNHPLAEETKSPGRHFFEDKVMPKLLTRGCALEGCHSPNGFNDFRLRPGAMGFLSPGAMKRNYEATLDEFMALDSVDVRQSRIVKKTLSSSGVGITHRGGGVLEDVGVSADAPCPEPFPADYDPTLPYSATNAKSARALCVLREWHRIERQDRAALVSPMASGDVLPLAFVSRPPNEDDALQFATYRGGADLKLADATMGPGGVVMSVGNVRSGLTACAALAGKDVDVRGPEWSYDGTKVVFAARPGATSGLDLWLLDVGAGTCRQLTTDNGRAVNGVPVHNFDPVFAPDGTVVFSSTRGGQLTLKTFLPNADLYRSGPNADFSGQPQQMTFLLGSEVAPAFMQDGRVSFTAEKATPEFYQLSGRRINWDLTDYHPLLAQRAQSTTTFTADMHPSVGYQQATEIREGLDRNFLLILSDSGARGGGGALATFNRSIGPFEQDRTEKSFLRSMSIVDPAATGRAGTTGVYRSPFSLPNGEILASYAANVTDPTTGTPKYDLVAVAEKGGARRALASDATLSYVEAALGYKRAERMLFRNVSQLVFGGHANNSSADSGVMHFPDLPLLATLLGANLRKGRNVEAFDVGTKLRVSIEQAPPGPGAAVTGSQKVYSQRTIVGTASLRDDKSLKVTVPARKPLIFEMLDDDDKVLFEMTEEHQVSPGEYVTPGAPRPLFNAICGGCHGSISGQELDVAVTPDALTGASLSHSRELDPVNLQ